MNKLDIIKSRETDARFGFMMEAVVKTLSQTALQIINAEKPVEMGLKPDGTHITEIDIALNKLFIELVERRFPGDIVWGEELQNVDRDMNLADDKWVWSLDPIDSTRSLVESLTMNPRRFKDNSSTILASATPPGEKAPVIGVVHSPFRNQKATAYAYDGESFYQTSNRPQPKLIHVNPAMAPRTMDEIQRFESSSWKGASPDLSNFGEMVPYARKINHQLFMAATALGDVDMTAFPGLSHPHDVAPGALIVHNAGGTVRTFSGQKFEEVDWREDESINGVLTTVLPELAEEIIEHVNQTRPREA